MQVSANISSKLSKHIWPLYTAINICTLTEWRKGFGLLLSSLGLSSTCLRSTPHIINYCQNVLCAEAVGLGSVLFVLISGRKGDKLLAVTWSFKAFSSNQSSSYMSDKIV